MNGAAVKLSKAPIQLLDWLVPLNNLSGILKRIIF